MKFSVDSVKLKSKSHNEDFCFELETPRGHFFALLDFASHDYANLNATLKSKLETIIGSFVSLSRFSAELFLSFMAKEINNFLHKLSEQSGGPELLASGALCLVSGNRLSYFLCGDVHLNIVNNGRVLPLFAASSGEAGKAIDRFGASEQQAQLNDLIQSFTLQDADLVLIATDSMQQAVSVDEVGKMGNDAKSVAGALMTMAASVADDRSLIVISGPYEKFVDPVLADLSKAISTLESRVDALAKNFEMDQQRSQQFNVFKDDLKGKATRIDLLELEQKLKEVSDRLNAKADAAEISALKNIKDGAPVDSAVGAPPSTRTGLPMAAVIAMVLGAALLGSLVGGWIQSRSARRPAEMWAVKNDNGQLTISRLDGDGGSVTLNGPPGSSGEQHFSSFADAKRYIDTLFNVQANSPAPPASVATPNASPSAESVTQITLKPGDSLKKLAAQYNVPQEKLMALNPGIKRWSVVRIGERITVPASTAPPPPAVPANAPVDQTAAPATANTTEVIVEPGDSLNRLASRYKVTPEQLKELNPQITNWATIVSGQKVLVPAQPGV